MYKDTLRTSISEIERDDREAVALLLQDSQVMYAWEHGFSDDEVDQWLEKNNKHVKKGIGFAKVNRKSDNQFLGVVGLIFEEIHGEKFLALAYIFRKEAWNQGYATETGKALLEFAFESNLANKILCDMRRENIPSKRVAEKLGMKQIGEFVKIYKGKEMPHFLFGISKVKINQ